MQITQPDTAVRLQSCGCSLLAGVERINKEHAINKTCAWRTDPASLRRRSAGICQVVKRVFGISIKRVHYECARRTLGCPSGPCRLIDGLNGKDVFSEQ